MQKNKNQVSGLPFSLHRYFTVAQGPSIVKSRHRISYVCILIMKLEGKDYLHQNNKYK